MLWRFQCSNVSLFLWISTNTCPLNLLLIQSHQVEKLIIVKRLIQGRNIMTRVRDCKLNPDHAIRIVIKPRHKNLPTKFSRFANLYKSATPFFLW